MEFLKDNLSSIFVGIIVILIVTIVVKTMIKDRKNGKGSCGCHCGACKGCPSSGMCHAPKLVTINLTKNYDSDKNMSIK